MHDNKKLKNGFQHLAENELVNKKKSETSIMGQ
jgi:hypothetical protein